MIRTFIRRPVFTTMLVLLLVVFGIRAYPMLGLDLNPDVEFPFVAVTATYQGASPAEMENLVTIPIEDKVSQVAGIKTMTSYIREGFSQTVMEFEIGVDPKLMASEVREKVASIRKRLPDDIDEPVVERVDISAEAIAVYTISSKTRSRGEIRKLIEDVIKDELQRVQGVSDISVYGVGERELRVVVDSKKLAGFNIPMETVYNKINSSNVNTPGGSIDTDDFKITVRTVGKYTKIEDIGNVILTNDNGKIVRVKDVAKIIDDWSVTDSDARTNREGSVILTVKKVSGANTVEVADGVELAMQKMVKYDLPPDINIMLLRDSTKFIRDNVNDVWIAIIFGGFFALLITYLFLHNFRATIIGGLSIPVSIIASFAMMNVMGFTLNNMSLMGISLAVGILIDDAVVLIENVFRHMEMGKNPLVAAEDATKELKLAILATSMALLSVFIPIGTMGDVVGQFFRQFGLTVAFAVAFSTMCAYTLTPMLSAHFLKNPYIEDDAVPCCPKFMQKILETFEKSFQRFRVFYEEIINLAFTHIKTMLIGAVVVLAFSLTLVPLLGFEMQPTYDSGEFKINVTAPNSTNVERLMVMLEPIEDELLSHKEIALVGIRAGGRRVSSNKATIEVKMVSSDERDLTMDDLLNELRRKFKNNKNLRISVTTSQGEGRGDSRPIQVGIRGSDLDKLEGYAQKLATLLRQENGASDVEAVGAEVEPEIVIKVNAEKASELGLDDEAIGNIVKMAFMGSTTSNEYTIDDNSYDLRIQLEAKERENIDDVRNLLVATSGGKFVRLNDIARVEFSTSPTQINREDRQRQFQVYSNVVGVSAGEMMNTISDKLIPQLNMEPGYRYKFVGQSSFISRIVDEVSKAIILALIMIYMVLAAEFESFVQPLIIMVSVPFALIGAIIGLLVAGQTANMMSMIGFTMLLGLVTKNAILLVDYTNQARDRGLELVAAIKEACSLRLRPIFMTTFSTILGMLPIALGWGAGAELRQSMGVVLVGGLITSTMLTLIIVPLVYYIIEKRITRKHYLDD